MLGAIPCGLGILLANMMGGNTELRAIPEDYTPKEWEYFPNPITRSVTGNMTSLASSFDANFTTHLGIFERSSEKTRLDYIKVLRPIELICTYRKWKKPEPFHILLYSGLL